MMVSPRRIILAHTYLGIFLEGVVGRYWEKVGRVVMLDSILVVSGDRALILNGLISITCFIASYA